MASMTKNGSSDVVVTSAAAGVTVVDPSTPLRRLNYFDGKFLRAEDFEIEQRYMRRLVAASNQGLGAGVVYGYDTSLAGGDQIQIGPGLAIDPSGNVLLLQRAFTQSVGALIDESRKAKTKMQKADASGTRGDLFTDCIEAIAPPPSTTVEAVTDLYVIAICAAEMLCGQADVYGKLCEEACVTTTDRPYRLDSVVLRAIPLQLTTRFPVCKAVNILGDAYLRSKVAHSFYGDEVLRHPNAISRAGLLSELWCAGAGYDTSCCEVPLAVVALAGQGISFLDAWIVRRERMDAPARRYWQWRMRMRPYDVFLAQILQFQCQLADVLTGAVTPGDRGGDPCAPQHKVLADAAQFIDQIKNDLAKSRMEVRSANTGRNRPMLMEMSLSHVSDLHQRINVILKTADTPDQPADRILVRRGIIELPSAGYLPVMTGTKVTVNDQVRALLGDGVDLRFCVTTADYIAHAVEEAQHMDRISLVEGLDDPASKPKVDILVPDGRIGTGSGTTPNLFAMQARLSTKQTGALSYRGAAREDSLDAGGMALYAGGAGLSQNVIGKFLNIAQEYAKAKGTPKPLALHADLDTSAFINQPKATEARFASMLETAGNTARRVILNPGGMQRKGDTGDTRAAATYGTVEGLWLTAETHKTIRSLAVGEQAPVDVRVVLGRHPLAPDAIEVTFNGRLSITSVAAVGGQRVMKGTLTGIYAIGILKENEAKQRTTEYLVTERGTWPATITYTGDDSDGSIVWLVATEIVAATHLRIAKTYLADASRITYEAGFVPVTGGAGTPFARMLLAANPDVAKPDNPNHKYAETGLDLVQAALVVTDPTLKNTAETELFPAAPNESTELTIEAVRDWVMFTRRRHKQCAGEAAPAPVLQERRYRVLNIPAKTLDDAKNRQGEFEQMLKDPTKFAAYVKRLLEMNQRSLVVPFDGGAATTKVEPSAIESDWKNFLHPGNTIVFAAAGASGETEQSLQLERLQTVEAAVAADSKESSSATEQAILPYPDGAVPPDADGIMLFITLTVEAAERQDVFAANTDFFALARAAAQNPGGVNNPALSLPALIKNAKALIPLGTASLTAEPGGVNADDAQVVNAFKTSPQLQNSMLREAVVILRSGLSAAEQATCNVGGTKVANDLENVTGGGVVAMAPSITYTAAWPAATPSILIVEFVPIPQ